MTEKRPLLEMRGICKEYPGVKALDGVDFTVYPGEVHALVGENGAGKSTLIKIIMGIEHADSGQIIYNGAETSFRNSLDAKNHGVSAVFQELSQVPYLTVAENIFLGREKDMGSAFLRRREMFARAQKLAESYALRLDVKAVVSRMSMAERQIAEILKAIAADPKLLILDEPTSSLTSDEAEKLIRIVKGFRDRGIGIIYISHRMNELEELADRITVLRDGKLVDTRDFADVTMNQVVEMMVGRETSLFSGDGRPKPDYSKLKKVLEVRHLSQGGRFRDISFDLYAGEVLGISGLIGAGRSELMRILFGVDRYDGGQILLDGREIKIRCVRDAMDAGIVMVPESRQLQGLVLKHSIQDNIVLPQTRKYTSRWKLVQRKKVAEFARDAIRKYEIRTDSPLKLVRQLSGGNQQKVVIAKWLAMNPRVLIIDEPTVGVDVRSKGEIHRLIRELADSGVGVIMVSSDMPELLANSDRVMVLNNYKVLGILEDADQNSIMRSIMEDNARNQTEEVAQ